MKRWAWAALGAAVVAVVGVGGVVLHHGSLDGGERGEHEAMGPASLEGRVPNPPAQSTGMIAPHAVLFRSLPVAKPSPAQAQRPGKQAGGENESRERSQISEAEADARRAKAMQQPVRAAHIQQLREVSSKQRAASIQGGASSTDVLNVLAAFDGPDISQCCGNSASVPPDTHMAAGLNHVVATVNTAIGIYSKQGALLNGPVLSDAFFNSANCNGSFDPTVEYDEGADRWIINYDASPRPVIRRACGTCIRSIPA
jgi:hypothetical protein